MDLTTDNDCEKTSSEIFVDESVANEVADAITDDLVFVNDPDRQSPIPDYDDVVDLIVRLKAIVYPVFCEVNHAKDMVRERLRVEVADAGTLLARLIRRAVLRDAEACVAMAHRGCDEAEAIARSRELVKTLDQSSQEMSQTFLQKLPAIRSSLMKDVQAAYDGDPACQNFDEVILCYPGLGAVTIHRMAHELYKLKIPFLPRMMSEWSHGETGIDIHPGATIDDYFFIDHGTGVTCEIGKHVKIYQGVTLGALSFDKDERGDLVRGTKRHPTIQDNVVIYANATVLGGRTVLGHHSVVGSSVWLTRSIDPHTTVTINQPSLRMREQVHPDFEHPIDYQI